MIYKAHQIELWPRLLTATRAIDTVLAGALQDLMIRGASLTVAQSGKLLLGAGMMAPADYEAIKADQLMPRAEKLQRLLAEARTHGHPWLQAVVKALQDLEKKCQIGDKALADAAGKRNGELFMKLLPMVAERHYQANLLAQALFMGGYAQYDKPMSMHLGVWMDLVPKIAGGAKPAYGWPVLTDDGWFWVVDVARVNGEPYVPPTVTLDRAQGPKPWLEDEPLINDWELANALARGETGASWLKEAG